jgi:hypothetical protein
VKSVFLLVILTLLNVKISQGQSKDIQNLLNKEGTIINNSKNLNNYNNKNTNTFSFGFQIGPSFATGEHIGKVFNTGSYICLFFDKSIQSNLLFIRPYLSINFFSNKLESNIYENLKVFKIGIQTYYNLILLKSFNLYPSISINYNKLSDELANKYIFASESIDILKSNGFSVSFGCGLRKGKYAFEIYYCPFSSEVELDRKLREEINEGGFYINEGKKYSYDLLILSFVYFFNFN